MNVLVVGASGLVGGTVTRVFKSRGYSVVGTYLHDSNATEKLRRMDISDRLQTLRIVQEISPEIIIHAAAMTNVDLCQVERDRCFGVNVLGTQHVVDAARTLGARLIFFSTDYIFDGVAGPYYEHDAPNPINFYGACKLEAENRIRKGLHDYLIARLTVVYGWERQGKNFAMRLMANLRKGEKMNVPVDQIGTPTYANNIAEAVLDLVQKRQSGVFNIAGPELMDRYSFAKLAAETFGLPKELLIPTTTADLGQTAARPLNAGLKTDKLRSVSQVRMLPPRGGLRLMRESKEELM